MISILKCGNSARSLAHYTFPCLLIYPFIAKIVRLFVLKDVVEKLRRSRLIYASRLNAHQVINAIHHVRKSSVCTNICFHVSEKTHSCARSFHAKLMRRGRKGMEGKIRATRCKSWECDHYSLHWLPALLRLLLLPPLEGDSSRCVCRPLLCVPLTVFMFFVHPCFRNSLLAHSRPIPSPLPHYKPWDSLRFNCRESL